jgi:membrane protein DedA with SNARE-associated domain
VHGVWAYVWFVILLIGCSLGLPYPEEAVLFGAGYLAGEEGSGVTFFPAVIVCGLGVLLGDSMIYGLGRYGGPPVLQRWPFRKHFTPRRIRRTRAAFLKHGAKLLLPIRIVPVARAVAHFTAGMLSYSYWRFLLG